MGAESSIEGRQLGAYRLGRRLGAGGIGAVYAAAHVRTGRGYAVKVLLPEAASDATAAARFRREAEALAAVGHSGIVAVHDFDVTDDGIAYLVMDKLEGEDLDARLARGPMSLAATLGLLHEVGSALSAAHDAGILHRDLKPSNIFLARRPGAPETAVLLDFGLAKLMEGEHAKLTATGATMGTPMYMSPEQAQGLVVDRRTDVYALGAVLFECLTGRPPFDGPNVTAILAKVLTQPPPRIRDWNPSFTKGLEDVLVRALSKDPHERPATVPALVAAVSEAAGDAPSERAIGGARVVPPTQATPMVVEVHRPPTRRTGALVVASLATLAVVVGGVVAWLVHDDAGGAAMPVVAPVRVEGADDSPVEAPVEPAAAPRTDVDDGALDGALEGSLEGAVEGTEPTKGAPTKHVARPVRRPRETIDLGSLGAAGVLAQLPRARAVLARERHGLELERPRICALPPDDAALRVLPEGPARAEALSITRRTLCATTPALASDRARHEATVAAVAAHLDRLEAAARGR